MAMMKVATADQLPVELPNIGFVSCQATWEKKSVMQTSQIGPIYILSMGQIIRRKVAVNVMLKCLVSKKVLHSH